MARPLILNRLFSKKHRSQLEGQRLVDVYQASVEKCFVPASVNEEHPLFLLDVGGLIMILFGEWLYDPCTLIAPKSVFENWDGEDVFFGKFVLRCAPVDGTVLRLTVEDDSFIRAQRLPPNLRFRRLRECLVVEGSGVTLIDDLRKAGIAEME